MFLSLQFLGATRTVTGSCYLLTVGEKKILIDCGMFQGNDDLEAHNSEEFAFDPANLDVMILTHAHIDHCGLIPKLVRAGFDGRVFCTHPTKDICEILLPDSAYIQEEQLKNINRKRQRAGKAQLEPIYTLDDVQATLPLFDTVPYNQIQEIDSTIEFRFQDAGHILGSASLELWVKDEDEEGKPQREKIVFSGDIGNFDTAILRDPTYIDHADFVVMESTYGDHLHRSRKDTVEEFRQIITDAFEKGGNIIIPAFAVERTQEILYELGRLCDEESCPNIPVFIDSPLAINATEIFRKHPQCYDEATWEILRQGKNPLDLPQLRLTRTASESKKINDEKRALIISASGMAHAGRILHHLKHNLWRPESHVIFVGYQAHGTLGRQILDGAKTVRIFGEEIAVKATIHSLGGFSAHADQAGLTRWLAQMSPTPQQVFLTHGEEEKMKVLSKHFQQELGVEPYLPQYQEEITLEVVGRK